MGDRLPSESLPKCDLQPIPIGLVGQVASTTTQASPQASRMRVASTDRRSMFRPELGPVDKPIGRLRRALLEEAESMETRYWIARLRALITFLENESLRNGDNAIEETGATLSSVMSGKALGYAHAASKVEQLLRELLVKHGESERN